MSDETKYPEIVVSMIGEDGNAFSILGRVNRALREHGVSPEECRAFTEEATKATYDDLLNTVQRWVNIT